MKALVWNSILLAIVSSQLMVSGVRMIHESRSAMRRQPSRRHQLYLVHPWIVSVQQSSLVNTMESARTNPFPVSTLTVSALIDMTVQGVKSTVFLHAPFQKHQSHHCSQGHCFQARDRAKASAPALAMEFAQTVEQDLWTFNVRAHPIIRVIDAKWSHACLINFTMKTSKLVKMSPSAVSLKKNSKPQPHLLIGCALPSLARRTPARTEELVTTFLSATMKEAAVARRRLVTLWVTTVLALLTLPVSTVLN